LSKAAVSNQPKTINKFWRFNPANAATNTPAELLLYGDISSFSWWGDEVTPKKFNEELAALGDVSEITVRINSGGGDVFAATAIFTRLKDHSATITVIIDGWAASAASIIAMAGDVIKIPAAGCLMIHDPALTLWGRFEADDFVKFKNELEVVKNCIVNAYAMKTGKPKEELAALMAAETWLTGEEAVEAGFCDEVLFADSEAVAVVADVSRYKNPPINFFRQPEAPPAKGNTASNSTNKPNKEEGVKNRMEIKTVEELRAAYPALAAEIESTAAAAERKRIQAIENIALGGYEDLVNKAKFETPLAANDLAVQILAEQKRLGGEHLKNTAKDVEESGVNDVNAASHTGGPEDKENVFDAAIDSVLPAADKGGRS